MPYQPISNMSRRGEKLAPFLTTQNVLGMIVLAVPAYVLASPLPPALRVAVTLLMATLAYVSTNESRGMAPYERVLWRLRGRVRTLMRGAIVSPTALPDAVLQVRVPVSRQGGSVRLLVGAPEGIGVAAAGRRAGRRRPRAQLASTAPSGVAEVPDAHP
jgi:hypothetical protein